MYSQLRTLSFASIAIAALGLASSATLVQSAEKGQQGRHAVNANKNRHCVTNLSKPDIPATCYDTFTAAIAAATGGQVTDAPADSREAMKDQRLMARLNATDDKKRLALNAPADKKSEAVQPTAGPDVLIGIIYYDDGFGGPTHQFLGPRCTDTGSDIDKAIPYVGDDWNDDFEAVRGFNNCAIKVWEHRDFGGASTPFLFEAPDLGVLNDEGSALQFS